MRTLIALIVALNCSFVNAREWYPESPYRPAPPQTCRPHGHYEWHSRVLRRYWVVLPCGRRELWEDVLKYKVWIEDSPRDRLYPGPFTSDLDRWSTDTGYGEYR